MYLSAMGSCTSAVMSSSASAFIEGNGPISAQRAHRPEEDRGVDLVLRVRQPERSSRVERRPPELAGKDPQGAQRREVVPDHFQGPEIEPRLPARERVAGGPERPGRETDRQQSGKDPSHLPP